MLHSLVWLIVGGLVGWIAFFVLRSHGWTAFVVNIVVAAIGAYTGEWLFSAGNIDNIGTPLAVIVALVGAIDLLAVFNLVRGSAD